MIKRILFWLLPFTLLFGCNEAPRSSFGDGYHFEQAEFLNTNIALKLVLAQDQKGLKDLWERHGNDSPFNRNLRAFARVDEAAKTCTIYALDSRAKHAPQWLGHELEHCIYGQWHPTQGESGR